MSDRTYFVSDWLKAAILTYHENFGVPVTQPEIQQCNAWLYRKYPEVSERTIRQSTAAIRSGDYRSKLTQPHYTAMPVFGIVPTRFSDYDEYVSRMKELILRCRQERRRIRLVNIQDGHREHADPALLDLAAMVIQDFDPDYVPMMCDMVDNTLFQNYTHGSSYREITVDANGGEPEDSAISKAMIAFEEGTLDWANTVKAVTRSDTLKPVWLGNHEIWILRYLTDQLHSSGYFFNNFFPKLKKAGVLWTNGDTTKELPVTDNVIAVHGWVARSGNYGATANGYLRHYDSNLSVFAGHSHRMETVWSKPHPYTGGQNFVNICGTLGTVRPGYAQRGYLGHTQGFTLAFLAPEGNIGHEIHEVRIQRVKDFYECFTMGHKYRIQATVDEIVNPFMKTLDNVYD